MMARLEVMLIAVSANAVFSVLLKATVTTAAALLGVRLAHRSRAAVRHVLLLAAFGVLLALPIAAVVVPEMTIVVPVTTPVVSSAGRVDYSSNGTPTATAAIDVLAPAVTHVTPRVALPSIFSILAAAWGVGVVLSMLPIAIGLWQIGSLRRSALPWLGDRALVSSIVPAEPCRRIDVLLHENVPGPMTCGLLRHVILLPRDAERWAADELRRALVHELEHVRRNDWLSQCLARMLCAVYWFHPLVWMAWRRFTLEAERVCDDAVLRHADAAQYAEQLVALARRLSIAGKAPVLAMASRHDLAARVTAVLDDRQPRGQAGRHMAVLAIVAGAVIVAAIGPVRMIAGASASGDRPAQAVQSPPAQRFEAVSIRPCVDDTPPVGANGGARSGQGGFPTISPGRFAIDCGTVERLISNAYVLNGEQLENNHARIGDVSWWKGGPEWIRYDKFTIEASAPGVTDRAVLLGPMLRALLEDRFKLTLHRETQDAPMYAMTVAKGGLKIQPMPPGGCTPVDQVDRSDPRAQAAAVIAGTAKPTCGGMTMIGGPGHSRWTIGGTTIPNFAGTLTASMDHFVIDKTGLDSETKYNIHLEFAPDEHVPGADKRNPRTEFAPPDAPTIFAALEQQLGLKLEPVKGPQAVLVIDHIERPTPDGATVVPMRARGPGR